MPENLRNEQRRTRQRLIAAAKNALPRATSPTLDQKMQDLLTTQLKEARQTVSRMRKERSARRIQSAVRERRRSSVVDMPVEGSETAAPLGEPSVTRHFSSASGLYAPTPETTTPSTDYPELGQPPVRGSNRVNRGTSTARAIPSLAELARARARASYTEPLPPDARRRARLGPNAMNVKVEATSQLPNLPPPPQMDDFPPVPQATPELDAVRRVRRRQKRAADTLPPAKLTPTEKLIRDGLRAGGSALLERAPPVRSFNDIARERLKRRASYEPLL